MKIKNRFTRPLLVFIGITVLWYLYLVPQIDASFCEMVDCVRTEEMNWPMLIGPRCCGGLTTFRDFLSQLAWLIAPGITTMVIILVARRSKH
ncbi:TPA: hypothetical protein DDZ10_03835 [Candidatus Uhrbacteria bacterium]|nr:hypothetical protein [Candidatus Uhrbacteria bacterium]